MNSRSALVYLFLLMAAVLMAWVTFGGQSPATSPTETPSSTFAGIFLLGANLLVYALYLLLKKAEQRRRSAAIHKLHCLLEIAWYVAVIAGFLAWGWFWFTEDDDPWRGIGFAVPVLAAVVLYVVRVALCARRRR